MWWNTTSFRSIGFNLDKYISKSVLPDDVFAVFAKEFAAAVPDAADITESKGKVSARVGDRELVLTVVELEREDGMKVPDPDFSDIYHKHSYDIDYRFAIAWTVNAYEDDEWANVDPARINKCSVIAYDAVKAYQQDYNKYIGDRPTKLVAKAIREQAEAADTFLEPTDWVDIFIEKLPDNAKIIKQSDYSVTARVDDGEDYVGIRFEGDRVSLWLTVEYSMSDQVYGRSQPSPSELERNFDSVEQLKAYDLSKDIKRLFSARFGKKSYGTLGT